MKWIVVVGNPIDGLTFIGPFDDEVAAVAHCEGWSTEWHVAQLEAPE